jgi:hypothetical protein
MEKREQRTNCAGGILADDQVWTNIYLQIMMQPLINFSDYYIRGLENLTSFA